MAPGAVDWLRLALAVTVEPFRPNETLLLFENTAVPDEMLDALADRAMPPPATPADAVTVEPLIPNETLFEFEKTTVPFETELPDAETASSAPQFPASLGVCMVDQSVAETARSTIVLGTKSVT
jgi:hypothetical protein